MTNPFTVAYKSFIKGFLRGPVIFFAPFIGAWKAVKLELNHKHHVALA